jgi:uncharacterized membrane protein (DUF485 family)
MSETNPPASPTPAPPPSGDLSTRRAAQIGLLLFFMYFALYGGFMALTVTRLDILGSAFGGVNVAIWYGFGLILAALGLAFFYMWLCRGDNKKEGQA